MNALPTHRPSRLPISLAAGLLISLCACQRPEPASVPTSATVGQPASNAASQVQAVSESDADFVKRAAERGLVEAAVGKVARERASDLAVRKLAGMIGGQHTQLNSELATLAAARGIQIPEMVPLEKHQSMQQLIQLQGAAFDKRFIEEVGIRGHEEGIALFQQAGKEVQDPALKAWFTKSVPILELHLAQARDIAAGGGDRSQAAGPESNAASNAAGVAASAPRS